MKQGFTLIEVLISMAIFSLIAVGTGSAVLRGTTVKRRVEKEWQDIHRLRTAYRIMSRDIYLAFHHLKEKKPGMTFFRTKEESPWFKTYFLGKSNKLYFTSLSNRRLYTNTHESELCEIGYEIQPNETKPERMDLKRRKDTIIDDDQEKGGEFLVLLEGIQSLEFRYYSKKQDRWSEDWDSTHRDFEDQFPDAVEVKYTLPKAENKREEYTYVFLVAYPNNEQPKGEAQQSQPSQPGQGQNQGQGQGRGQGEEGEWE